MPDLEAAVADHYTTGSLTERIREALVALGVDPDDASPDDLKPVDEFHTGGLKATEDLLSQIRIAPTDAVLDLGSGLGGTARWIAAHRGAHVTGVDLTPEFVETARDLSAVVGLADLTDFHTGSALDPPVADAAFDVATMLHV
ncbi:MAG: class I SAM-dependent methyltransferase, partial [Pseudomonadota bacterium]